MKHVMSMIILCSAVLSIRATTEKIMGPGSYTNKTFDALEVMGPLTGKRLKASTIDIYGAASLSEGSEIGSATIRGPLLATQATFSDAVDVHGNIQATDSTFKGDLNTEGNDVRVVLENSSAQAINLTGIAGTQKSTGGSVWSTFFSSSKKEPQGSRVILRGKKTSVAGPIEFITTEGKVVLEDNASYAGKIINGTLEKPVELPKKVASEKEEGAL